ncbi:MAG TPA: hypothetical protein VKT27_08770 [Candidatus Binataceae bacterium]|nr:hypothetical protein [Candidatus Binataceae bacterium]
MDAAAYLAAISSPAQTRVATAPRRRRLGTPLPRWARIFILAVMLTTSLAGVVTHDLLLRWNAESCLRVEATGMAIAGATFLPGAPERALAAAARSANLFGLAPAQIVDVAPAGDRMSFRVTLRQTVPVLLFGLLESAGGTVTVQATASVHPYAAPLGADRATVLSMRRLRSAARAA